MTFKVTKASDWNFEDEKTFATLEELKDYITAVNDKDNSCVILVSQSYQSYLFMISGLSKGGFMDYIESLQYLNIIVSIVTMVIVIILLSD